MTVCESEKRHTIMKAGILSKSQQIEFDRPPKFSLVERRMVFEIPDSLRGSLRKLESTSSIVGFILQYGYFKTSGTFFYVNTFNSEDTEVICKWNKFNINANALDTIANWYCSGKHPKGK